VLKEHTGSAFVCLCSSVYTVTRNKPSEFPKFHLFLSICDIICKHTIWKFCMAYVIPYFHFGKLIYFWHLLTFDESCMWPLQLCGWTLVGFEYQVRPTSAWEKWNISQHFFHHAGSADGHMCSAVCILVAKEFSSSLGVHMFSFQLWCVAFMWETWSSGNLIQDQNFALTNVV